MWYCCLRCQPHNGFLAHLINLQLSSFSKANDEILSATVVAIRLEMMEANELLSNCHAVLIVVCANNKEDRPNEDSLLEIATVTKAVM